MLFRGLLLLSHPTKRYRSAVLSVIARSSQTVVFTALLLLLVPRWRAGPAGSPESPITLGSGTAGAQRPVPFGWGTVR